MLLMEKKKLSQLWMRHCDSQYGQFFLSNWAKFGEGRIKTWHFLQLNRSIFYYTTMQLILVLPCLVFPPSALFVKLHSSYNLSVFALQLMNESLWQQVHLIPQSRDWTQFTASFDAMSIVTKTSGWTSCWIWNLFE